LRWSYQKTAAVLLSECRSLQGAALEIAGDKFPHRARAKRRLLRYPDRQRAIDYDLRSVDYAAESSQPGRVPSNSISREPDPAEPDQQAFSRDLQAIPVGQSAGLTFHTRSKSVPDDGDAHRSKHLGREDRLQSDLQPPACGALHSRPALLVQ